MKMDPIIGPGHLAGVEAQHQVDGTWRFNWVHLRKRKSGVLVQRQGSGITDARSLRLAVGPRYPLAMVVTGERVLLRDMPHPFDVARDLGKMLPNARPEDLVISSCVRAEHTEVGVVRAQIVIELLAELEKEGMRVVRMFVGTSIRRALHGLVQDDPERRDEVSPNIIEPTMAPSDEEPVKLGTESVDRSSLLAFAAAWQYWFHPLELTTSSVPQVEDASNEERYRHRYEVGSVVATVLLLILLSGDILLRDHLDVRQAHLQGALEQQRHTRSELDSLGEAVRLRKELISAAGIGHAGGTMHFLDEVSASVPVNIVLDEIWLAPATKALMEGEPMKRERNTLLIQGHAIDPATLPVWVSRLGIIDGVRNARLESLESDPNEGTPIFRIRVELS